MARRNGLSLIETIIAIGMLGLLVGLMLPAVMKIRAIASQTKCLNNHRQVILGLHQHAADRDGELPYYKNGSPPPMVAVLPYLEQADFFSRYMNGKLGINDVVPTRQFLCPSDPSLMSAMTDRTHSKWGWTSVATNWQVFGSRSNVNSSITDGLSSTLATAEHYAICRDAYFSYTIASYNPLGSGEISTFAGPGAAIPVTLGNPAVSLSNLVGKRLLTFQQQPRESECSSALAQGSHPGGMVVTFFDGSARILRPTIDPRIYWGATTPNRGEVIAFE